MDVAALTANAQTGAAKASKKIAEDFDNFLVLLTTQLQNQDPLEPMDANEFTAQLVRFTTVEQSIASNKNLEALLASANASQAAAAVNYLGTRVEATGTENELTDAGASWTYTLPKASEQTTILIKDSTGNVVFSTAGETNAGKHAFDWNGQTQNGTPVPQGVYRIQVTATQPNGDVVGATTGVVGVVTGVETVDGEQMLTIGGAKVPFDGVIAVSLG